MNVVKQFLATLVAILVVSVTAVSPSLAAGVTSGENLPEPMDFQTTTEEGEGTKEEEEEDPDC